MSPFAAQSYSCNSSIYCTALGYSKFNLSYLKILQLKKLLSAEALVETLEGHKFHPYLPEGKLSVWEVDPLWGSTATKGR